MTTIAFLGLGHMGGPMAANLVAAGHTVRGFDPVAALAEAAADKGAQIFDSGAQAASNADVVITSLPNGDVVKAVYAEALPAAPKGHAVHRHLHHLGRRRARDPRAGRRAGTRSARCAGLRRRQGCDGRHAGLYGRRRGRRRRAGPAGAGTVGGQDHSLWRLGHRSEPPSCATTWCWPSSRSRRARHSCSPRSSACPRSRCST